MSRPVEIPRTAGQVQIELDCEACGRAVPVIILIDRPLGSPLTWSGVMCRCGASQTIELMSEPEELNKIPPMVSSGSDERGEDEEPVVGGALVIEKHRIEPASGKELARSIYVCGPLRSTVEEARFDALLFDPVTAEEDLVHSLKAVIALSASMHNQAAPGGFTGLDSTAEAVAAALIQRFKIHPRGGKPSRFDVDVAKLSPEDLRLLYVEAAGYLGLCALCGCSDHFPCLDANGKTACYWAMPEDLLCSRCKRLVEVRFRVENAHPVPDRPDLITCQIVPSDARLGEDVIDVLAAKPEMVEDLLRRHAFAGESLLQELAHKMVLRAPEGKHLVRPWCDLLNPFEGEPCTTCGEGLVMLSRAEDGMSVVYDCEAEEPHRFQAVRAGIYAWHLFLQENGRTYVGGTPAPVHVVPTSECEVRFYRANEKPWGPFSNLFRREVVFQGRAFATAEHAYQFGKPRKPEVRDWLMAAPSPGLLAMAAHGLYSWDINPGWSAGKVERMRQVLAVKFQDPELRELLLSTGEARIVEASTVDNEVNRFWGEVNGQGKNTLGVLLMELRARLRGEGAACPHGQPDGVGCLVCDTDGAAEVLGISTVAEEPEPKCPGCGAGVLRPKCLFELPHDECPRHELAAAYRQRQKGGAHAG